MQETTSQYPKVVVIGAGSLFFGRQAIWQMVHSPHLNRGTRALVDADEERLAFLVAAADKPRVCDEQPETKRFIVTIISRTKPVGTSRW